MEACATLCYTAVGISGGLMPFFMMGDGYAYDIYEHDRATVSSHTSGGFETTAGFGLYHTSLD
jgi:hypothetical protein